MSFSVFDSPEQNLPTSSRRNSVDRTVHAAMTDEFWAEAREGIDEYGHPYVGEERLLAFIEGYAAARGPL